MTHLTSRRDLLKVAACGFGHLALAGLAAERAVAEAANPLAPRPPHFAPRAKRIIFLFMQGGVSQVDSFDYKPRLDKDDGKTLPFDDARVDRQYRDAGLVATGDEVRSGSSRSTANAAAGRPTSSRRSTGTSTTSASSTRCTPRAWRTARRRSSFIAGRRTRSGPRWAPGFCTGWAPRTRTSPASSRSRRRPATAGRGTTAMRSCRRSSRGHRLGKAGGPGLGGDHPQPEQSRSSLRPPNVGSSSCSAN